MRRARGNCARDEKRRELGLAADFFIEVLGRRM